MIRRTLLSGVVFAVMAASCGLAFLLQSCTGGVCDAGAAGVAFHALVNGIGVVLAATALVIVARVAWMAWHSGTALERLPVIRAGAELREAAARAGVSRMRCVAATAPLAFTAGMLWPRVYVTSSMAESFDIGELTSVLAHERAHCRRRDPLRASLWHATADVLGLVPLVRWWSTKRTERAEILADRHAVRCAGSAALASALTRTVHAEPALRPTGVSGLSGRVAALLGDGLARPRPSRSELLASLGGAAVIGGTLLCVAPLLGNW